MRYSRVLNLNIYNKLFQFIIKNRLLIVLTILFLFGFSFAIFSNNKYEIVVDWSESFLKNYIIKKSSLSFFNSVIDSFLSSMLFFVFCLISGTSMLGVIIVPLIVAVRGYLFGCISAYLYSVYSFEGVAFHAVIILPSAIIFTITLIFCSIDCIKFSFNLAKLTFKENSLNNIFFEFRNLTVKLLIYSLFIFISAVIESLLYTSFLKNFSGILQ